MARPSSIRARRLQRISPGSRLTASYLNAITSTVNTLNEQLLPPFDRDGGEFVEGEDAQSDTAVVGEPIQFETVDIVVTDSGSGASVTVKAFTMIEWQLNTGGTFRVNIPIVN